MNEHIDNFKTYLFRMGYAESTIKSNASSLLRFLSHLKQQNIKDLSEATPANLTAYNNYLHSLKSRITGRGLSSNTIIGNVNVIRLFSQYLELTQNLKIYTIQLETEKSIKNHKAILSQEQIKQLYNETDQSVAGLRDKALLGLYYGCGLRFREGLNIETNHIDYKKELLYVSAGKSYESRYVPINTSVLKDFIDYEKYSRNQFTTRENYFIGGNTSNGFLNKWLQSLCDKAKINKEVTLHSLRHSIATHLLQKNMPLEQIAKFLGHRSLEATKIYTHIVNEI